MQLRQKKQPREIVAHREQKVQEVNTREEQNNKSSAQFKFAQDTPRHPNTPQDTPTHPARFTTVQLNIIKPNPFQNNS